MTSSYLVRPSNGAARIPNALTDLIAAMATPIVPMAAMKSGAFIEVHATGLNFDAIRVNA